MAEKVPDNIPRIVSLTVYVEEGKVVHTYVDESLKLLIDRLAVKLNRAPTLDEILAAVLDDTQGEGTDGRESA